MAGVALPLLCVCAAVAWWLPSNEALAARVAAAAQQRLGVGVTVGALHWQLLPSPQVVLRDIATQQPQPLRVQAVHLWPRLLSLLRGRVEIDRVLLDGGYVAQRSLQGLGDAAVTPDTSTPVEIARVAFRDLNWVTLGGVAAVYEGEADLEPGLVLRRLQLRRPGVTPPADLDLRRAPEEGGVQRYVVQARLGGGAAKGVVELVRLPDGRQRLQGRLSPRGVEVQAALAAFHRRSPVAGRADGETTLQAEADTTAGLLRDLRTETRFTMVPATLLRFDLDRTIQTLGRDHAGETTLERLTGRVQTYRTPEGLGLRFLDLQASAGSLHASGQATLQARRLDATAAVDLVDGVVGVPMRIQGPLGSLRVTVDKAPLLGAVAGTAVLPGVGTAIGAAIGRVLGGAAKPSP